FIAVPGPQGQQRHCHAQHEGRKERSHVVGRLCCSGYTRPTLAGCRFRRKRLSARQVENQSVHRHELQEGNRSAELRKERQEGRDLVCMRGGKSRRSKLQFAGDVIRALAPWADRCIDMIQWSAILISQRKRIVMTFPKVVFIAVWLLSGSVTFGQTAVKKTLT